MKHQLIAVLVLYIRPIFNERDGMLGEKYSLFLVFSNLCFSLSSSVFNRV